MPGEIQQDVDAVIGDLAHGGIVCLAKNVSPRRKRLEAGLQFVLLLPVGVHKQLELAAVQVVAKGQGEAADRVSTEICGEHAEAQRPVGAKVVPVKVGRLAKRIGMLGRPLPMQPGHRLGILVGGVVERLQREAAPVGGATGKLEPAPEQGRARVGVAGRVHHGPSVVEQQIGVVGRERVSLFEEAQRAGLVAAQREVGHLPHCLDVVGIQREAACEGGLGLLVVVGAVQQMAKEVEYLEVVWPRLRRLFQHRDRLVVSVEHCEAAAEQEQSLSVGPVPREDLLCQLGGLGEVPRFGPFGGLAQQRL